MEPNFLFLIGISFLNLHAVHYFSPPGTIGRYLGEGVLAQLSAAFSSTASNPTQRLAGHNLAIKPLL